MDPRKPAPNNSSNNNNNNNNNNKNKNKNNNNAKRNNQKHSNNSSTPSSRNAQGNNKFSSKPSKKPPTIKDFENPKFPFVDTHMHLDLIFTKLTKDAWTKENYNKIIQDWEEMTGQNLLAFLNVVCFPESFMSAEWQLENLQDDNRLFLSFGIHPHAAKDFNDSLEKKMTGFMDKYPKKVIAWGEMGLDYFKNFSPHDIQREVFRKQLILATKRKLPLIIHTRDADEDTFNIMSELVDKKYDSIHFHCFGGNLKFCRQLVQHFENCFFGFTGACTFTNAASTREVIEYLPLEKILLETDGPFMAPEGFRGQTAHPGHLPWVVAQIAKVKGLTVQKVAEQTTLNAQRMYRVFPPSHPYGTPVPASKEEE